MQEWTRADDYRVKTIKFGNATIYVKRPILPKAEYQRREKAAQNALEAYGRAIK